MPKTAIPSYIFKNLSTKHTAEYLYLGISYKMFSLKNLSV